MNVTSRQVLNRLAGRKIGNLTPVVGGELEVICFVEDENHLLQFSPSQFGVNFQNSEHFIPGQRIFFYEGLQHRTHRRVKSVEPLLPTEIKLLDLELRAIKAAGYVYHKTIKSGFRYELEEIVK